MIRLRAHFGRIEVQRGLLVPVSSLGWVIYLGLWNLLANLHTSNATLGDV